MPQDDNCVGQILNILGKIDILIELTEDLSITVDDVTTQDEFVSIAGSANVFTIMKNIALAKSILHNISASMMDISRSQSIKYGDSKEGPSMNPQAAKTVSKIVEVIKEEYVEEEPESEQIEEKSTEKQKEENLTKVARKEKSPEEKQKIEDEKTRRRSIDSKKQQENLQVGNVLDYFKQKFEEEDDIDE